MDSNADVRRVRSKGLDLAVRERSPWAPGKQSIVLVHGYPDQQDVWDRVVGDLDLSALHVVTYDVRGAGASDVPASRNGYRTELLAEDLVAVVDATVPESEPFHLVGHDWGSVQLWDVLAREHVDARLRGRIATFTSISGPSLDHAAHVFRNRAGRRRRLLNQALHSWYVCAFHLPVVPELAWTAAGKVAERLIGQVRGEQLGRNARSGLELYRANIVRRGRRPGQLRTDVPVLVVHPTRDRFVTEVMLEDLESACSDVTVVKVDAGHWVPRSHSAEIAALVTAHVRLHPR